MTTGNRALPQKAVDWLVIFAIFVLGFWLVAVRSLGPNLSQIPGDLGSTRFNTYVLEHDYRWITGQDPSLWDAPFFYPYPQTLTFSDTHFGSMFFYDAFRASGLDRETSVQCWYLLSFCLSFAAAAFVLRQFGLKPLAAGLGAFFFTFGLPLLGQETHIQLFYRFCIPLACYTFWQFSEQHRFKDLALTFFWLVWQFYLSIYMGYFLALLLFLVAVGLPFVQEHSLSNILLFWPRLFKKAWQNSKIGLNVLSFVSIAAFLLALYALFRPYIQASEMYKFERMWLEASRLFPRIQSYLIADNDILWQPVASLFTSLTDKIIYYRWEHQLFIGIPAAILLIAGLFWHFHSSYRKMLFIFLAASAFLVLLTLNVKGFTLYQYLWNLPGFSSIRSTSRVILVLMWPIAMFISIEADALLRVQAKHYIFTAIILSLLGLMATESIFFNHTTFSKADAQARLQTLKEQIPTNLPKDPVLYVWEDSNNGLIYTELDGMLLSQDLGWPALNGSSGNAPDGYGLADDCNQAVVRITQYIKFARIKDSNYYSEIISRLVPVGSGKCSWPAQMP